MSNQDRSIVSKAKRAGAFGLFALALSGCIIVKVPPPARNDPFQPPGGAPVTIRKGDTHRIRMNCGARVSFQSKMAVIENLVVDYNGKNLSPANQVPSAPMRLTWRGPGIAMDVPFNVGSENARQGMGNMTLNGGAGLHDFYIDMPRSPDCGPVNLTVTFR